MTAYFAVACVFVACLTIYNISLARSWERHIDEISRNLCSVHFELNNLRHRVHDLRKDVSSLRVQMIQDGVLKDKPNDD